tara:strand:- start:81 stop:488 length:408 start_codon:yes stop_codon:yes gene_type:complete
MMKLKLLLPFGVFKNVINVQRIVVETSQGSFGLLPQRLDCVAAIVPGILLYQVLVKDGKREKEIYVAVDAGVLVKTGAEVIISVRNAITGTDLNQLHNTVAQEFEQQSIQDKQVHSVFQKMESDFMRRLTVFHHD